MSYMQVILEIMSDPPSRLRLAVGPAMPPATR
jgi:hypothetical protein